MRPPTALPLLWPSLLLCAAAAACAPRVKPAGGGGPADPDSGGGGDAPVVAVVTTASQDYATGAFSTVTLDGWAVDDGLFLTSGDPVVRVSGGVVWQINRYGTDTLRAYAPGAWTRPLFEVSTGQMSNPVDAERCGDDLWVALYEEDALRRLDPETGLVRGSFDLSPWADGDGVGPEPASLLAVEGRLYVALQRRDRGDSWARRAGVVLAIDCAGATLQAAWPVGGNPKLHRGGGADGLLLTAEPVDGAGGSAGLYLVDPSAPDGDPNAARMVFALPADQPHAGPAAAAGGAAALIAYRDDWQSVVWCVDLRGGEPRLLREDTAFFNAAAPAPNGELWLSSHWGWASPEVDQTGLWVVDPVACAVENPDAPIALGMGPTALDFVALPVVSG
jgi:hypothetical protein